MVSRIKLYAPLSYYNATEEEKAEVCNGCGAKNGFKFPDCMWGLDIKIACDIHDWMFEFGVTQGDFDFANSMFDYNLRQIIKAKSNFVMRPLRLARSDKYVFGVEKFSESAFWDGCKEFNQDMSITYKGEFR
jgi:hypothetical protein